MTGRSSRVIEHPRKHRRIELFRGRDGGWCYHEAKKTDGGWRLLDRTDAPASPFRTYAECVAAAELTLGWVASALIESEGTATGYHMELLRGLMWHRTEYREEIHGEHSHCANCHATLMDRNNTDAEHTGYMTKYEIPFADGQWQCNWICVKCFPALQTALDWETGS